MLKENMIEFVDDINFDIKEYQALSYTLDYHKDKDLEAQYIAAGHNREQMGIHYCFETQQLPGSALEVKEKFERLYDNIAVAVNLFQPGHYLPMHHDLYGRYRSVFGDPNHERQVIRIIVMLENSEPGQIIQVGYMTWAQWRSGQVFWWCDDTPHAFYNMSLSPRYALQITGMIR